MMMALPNGSDVAIIAKTATRIAAMNGVAILNTVFMKPFAGGFKRLAVDGPPWLLKLLVHLKQLLPDFFSNLFDLLLRY